MEEGAEGAAAAKAQGNAALAAKDYAEAIRCYTAAIALDGSSHVYYSNRSAAHLGAASYGDAVIDADRCIQLKPDFAKGYGRKVG